MRRPTKYRKKPVEIEAVRYLPGDDCNCVQVATFLGEDPSDACECQAGGSCADLPWAVDTLEGQMTASPGDWIIRGVKGEFYPCKPDIFEATYEPVDPR